MTEGTKKAPRRKLPGLRQRFVFDDGSTVVRPLEEGAREWLAETARMFCSDERHHKVEAERRFSVVAAIMAKADAEQVHRKQIAPSSRSKNPLPTKVRELMKSYASSEFKSFLAAWEIEALNGLRLTLDKLKGTWLVEDENGDSSDSRTYKYDSLESMFSKARKRKN